MTAHRDRCAPEEWTHATHTHAWDRDLVSPTDNLTTAQEEWTHVTPTHAMDKDLASQTDSLITAQDQVPVPVQAIHAMVWDPVLTTAPLTTVNVMTEPWASPAQASRTYANRILAMVWENVSTMVNPTLASAMMAPGAHLA
jgi:putative intracellular protease/amidase